MTVLAADADAPEECDLADEVIDVHVVLDAKVSVAQVPNLFRVVQLANGYGWKRSVPIEAVIWNELGSNTDPCTKLTKWYPS